MTAPRRISVLGATGSVGLATLDLVARAAPGTFDVVALTARTNAVELARQAIRHRASHVAIADPAAAPELREALAGHPGISIGVGEDAVCEAAAVPADWTMAAIVGAAGLRPTLEAVRQGAALAFANKECLVCAGPLFMQEAARCGATRRRRSGGSPASATSAVQSRDNHNNTLTLIPTDDTTTT